MLLLWVIEGGVGDVEGERLMAVVVVREGFLDGIVGL